VSNQKECGFVRKKSSKTLLKIVRKHKWGSEQPSITDGSMKSAIDDSKTAELLQKCVTEMINAMNSTELELKVH
jgi:hypothetical protein